MNLLEKMQSADGKPVLCLAPMAGFSDRAMRLIAKEAGADYTVTEMISAKAVVFGDKKTFSLAKIGCDEGAVGLQIFGSEPSIMAEGAEKLLAAAEYTDESSGLGYVRPSAIDINMGCPVPKVFKNGEGSALMQSPEKIFGIVKAVASSAKKFGIPVSVKMRSGITPECRNAVECIAAAEEGGASWIALHPRTRVELYAGKADRDYAGYVKKCCHIPVIYSGDIDSAASATDALLRTGADGLMLGRGAVGNPFLFAEIRAKIENLPYRAPTLAEKKETALRQLRYAIADKGEYVAVSESRKQIARYFGSFRGSSSLRAAINVAATYAEIQAALSAQKFDSLTQFDSLT